MSAGLPEGLGHGVRQPIAYVTEGETELRRTGVVHAVRARERERRDITGFGTPEDCSALREMYGHRRAQLLGGERPVGGGVHRPGEFGARRPGEEVRDLLDVDVGRGVVHSGYGDRLAGTDAVGVVVEAAGEVVASAQDMGDAYGHVRKRGAGSREDRLGLPLALSVVRVEELRF